MTDNPGKTIEGTYLSDTLVGGFGDDTISGLEGNDTIDGQAVLMWFMEEKEMMS